MIRATRQERTDAGAQMGVVSRIPIGLVDGQQEARAQHDVDLAGPGVADVEREQDDVDELVGDLDLGPLISFHDVFGDQRMEAEQPRDFLDCGRIGVRDVDPQQRIRNGPGLGDRRQALGVGQLAVVPGRDTDDRTAFRCAFGHRRGLGLNRRE